MEIKLRNMSVIALFHNSHCVTKTTSGVKFDLIFDLSVPNFLYGKKFRKNWTTISCIF